MTRRGYSAATLFGLLWGCAAWTMAATVNLAWDAPSAGQEPQGYVLQRKTGQVGAYADLPLAIPGNATTASDATVGTGQIYCYQLIATIGPYRSLPSNEVCTAIINAPVNLRIQ